MRRTLVRGLVAAVGVAAGVCAAASTATAEVGAPAATVQAIAADAQFLEYAPPPAAPGVVCLIDSGVDPNPDTTPILAGSYAVQGGTDTSDELSKLDPLVEPGNHPNGHGTYMAMIMAAPVNGWGMVGIAPTSVRVFNVKSLAAGQSTFSFSTYAYATTHCLSGPAGVTGLTVVNLSLGVDKQPTPTDLGELADTVAEARRMGFSVVAAAGNDGGAVGYPAAISGVLAVGATDANPADLGVFCEFSDRGPVLAILAPGCGTQAEPGGGGAGIDVAFSDDGAPAWSFGTSQAAAVVSAVLASLRAYGPGLSVSQAEDCVTSTTESGGNLDAAAAFRACGLTPVVDEGMAAYEAATSSVPRPAAPLRPSIAPPTKPTTPGVSGASASGSARSPARPRVLHTTYRGGRLSITVAAVAPGSRLRIDVQRKTGTGRYQTVASHTGESRTSSLKVGLWDRVAVLFLKGRDRSAEVFVTRGPLSSSATSTANRRPEGS
jgi:hypothetical protein